MKPDPAGMVEIAPTTDIGQRALRRRRVERILAVLSPLILLGLWELTVRSGLLDARLFPAPSMIVGTFRRLVVSGELLDHVGISLSRIGVGFVMGAVPGIVVGVAMGLSPLTRAVCAPLIASLYPIPKIAIFPLIMVLFGLGEMSKYVLVAIAVFFFMAINAFTGVRNIDQTLWDVGASFKASRLRQVLTIGLPAALPMIAAGVRLSLGVSLLVLVSAEFVGAKAGIGYLVWNSWQIFDIEAMFVGIIVIAFLGWLFFALVDELERRLLPWKDTGRG